MFTRYLRFLECGWLVLFRYAPASELYALALLTNVYITLRYSSWVQHYKCKERWQCLSSTSNVCLLVNIYVKSTYWRLIRLILSRTSTGQWNIRKWIEERILKTNGRCKRYYNGELLGINKILYISYIDNLRLKYILY